MAGVSEHHATVGNEPALAEQLAPLVGRCSLQEVLAFVRGTLVRQALMATGGNKTRAAQLLGITRQAVQQLSGRSWSLSSESGRPGDGASAAIDHGSAGGDAQLRKNSA